MLLAQDCFFLGFPFFDEIDYQPAGSDSGFPIAFVKKAIVSALDENYIYLDGHNNPGFSGGPVIFTNYQTKKQQICGVISGYFPQKGEVETVHTKKIQIFAENSGIGLAISSKKIQEVAKRVFGKEI